MKQLVLIWPVMLAVGGFAAIFKETREVYQMGYLIIGVIASCTFCIMYTILNKKIQQ